LLGKSKTTATNAVFPIVLPNRQLLGTGFLHRSGKVITAYHVVQPRPLEEIRIATSGGELIEVTNCISNTNLDLAVLSLVKPLSGPSFGINTNEALEVGTPVMTWGFPGGYDGLTPLLSVGFISGSQITISPLGVPIEHMVVNAAFNGGNSGGPLIDAENRTVVGVVVSKLAPLPRDIEVKIDGLKKNGLGLRYRGVDASGKSVEVGSESQLLADIINYLRSQVQLVIGYAVPAHYLRDFLKTAGVDP
jgi:S1-C subfamily serine protease